MSGQERLRSAVARWQVARKGTIDQAPGCVFGLLTQDSVDDVKLELGRLRVSVDNMNKLLLGLLISVVLLTLGILVNGVFK